MGEQGSMPLGFGGLQRYLPFSCFLRFCSRSVYFNFFAIMVFLTFLYLCNCCHQFCLSICLFGLRRRNLSSSHLSEVKEKKKQQNVSSIVYWKLGPSIFNPPHVVGRGFFGVFYRINPVSCHVSPHC